MVFNSYTFVCFFAVVLFLHNLPFSWHTKKLNLVLASLLFYSAWNPPFVILLIFSTIIDWLIGNWLDATESPRSRKKILLISLASNLGLLGYFKYGNFVLDNFRHLCQLAGIELHLADPDIILPVGISFYTFQTLSYTLDIYLKRTRACKSFVDYALYVTFFPQLVAGPIVRSTNFIPQCEAPRPTHINHIAWGAIFLIIGLFEKVVLANGIFAPIADLVFDQGLYAQAGLAPAWIGALAFAGQIFCDFAGYSTCAIGAAKCLGFDLPINFRAPYAAVGFSDFWRRWHISLSTWLRDYLYIPLGGNRAGSMKTSANLYITMLLGGLWHGASWNFVVWGFLHGLLLSSERVLCQIFPHSMVWQRGPGRMLLGMLTFFCICVTWVVFRSHDLNQAWNLSIAMLGFGDSYNERLHHVTINYIGAMIALLSMLTLILFQCLTRNVTLEHVIKTTPWWIVAPTLALMIVAITTIPGNDRAFIYFQF